MCFACQACVIFYQVRDSSNCEKNKTTLWFFVFGFTESANLNYMTVLLCITFVNVIVLDGYSRQIQSYDPHNAISVD